MLEFIKMFGLGMLYTLLFPFIIAIFGVYVVYVLGNYIVLELINFFGFFFGYSFSTQTELEKKLDNMKSKPVIEEGSYDSSSSDFDDFFLQSDVTEDLKGSDEHE